MLAGTFAAQAGEIPGGILLLRSLLRNDNASAGTTSKEYHLKGQDWQTSTTR
jgi:hypothetical protein